MATKYQYETATMLNSLDLCGCGGSSEWEIVLLVLDRANRKLSLYDEAEDASGRWVEFAAKVLDGKGFLDHGTSIGYAWLTDEGESLLGWLRTHGTDTDAWPEWWMDLTPPAEEVR